MAIVEHLPGFYERGLLHLPFRPRARWMRLAPQACCEVPSHGLPLPAGRDRRKHGTDRSGRECWPVAVAERAATCPPLLDASLRPSSLWPSSRSAVASSGWIASRRSNKSLACCQFASLMSDFGEQFRALSHRRADFAQPWRHTVRRLRDPGCETKRHQDRSSDDRAWGQASAPFATTPWASRLLPALVSSSPYFCKDRCIGWIKSNTLGDRLQREIAITMQVVSLGELKPGVTVREGSAFEA